MMTPSGSSNGMMGAREGSRTDDNKERILKAGLKNARIQRYTIAVICLILSIPVPADEEGYHTFSDMQGRTIKGQLMDYETASETVVLQRADGKTGSMQLAKFCEADRLFILDWAASRRFHDGLECVLTLSSSVVLQKELGISDATKKVFDVFYEIRFMNRSDAAFEKLDFEYCIFYNQGERQNGTVQYEEGSCYGKGVVELLGPSSEQGSQTKSIRLYTEGGSVGLFGANVISLANVRGVWLRFKTQLPSGSEIMREYRTSDDELWEWAPYSFGAGLNEGEKKQTFYIVK